MTSRSTPTHSAERDACLRMRRVLRSVAAREASASSSSPGPGRTTVLCSAKAFRPPPARGQGNLNDGEFSGRAHHALKAAGRKPERAAGRKPRTVTRGGRLGLFLSRFTVYRPRLLVLVLAVVLVGLALLDARGLPDEAAPLVGLAEQLERGERLDGVALKAQDFRDRLQRSPLGVGHDEVDAAAHVGQAL